MLATTSTAATTTTTTQTDDTDGDDDINEKQNQNSEGRVAAITVYLTHAHTYHKLPSRGGGIGRARVLGCET